MPNRNQTTDLLKGIAVLLMIQVHIIELFASNDVFSSFYGKLLLFFGGPPVAPVFALILGYNIASSSKTTKQLIIRGLNFLILGMVLNIALNFNLIVSVYKGLIDVDLLPYIFGVDILQFAGISIIVISIIKKILSKNIILIIFSTILVAFLGQFLIQFIPENITLKYITSFFYGTTHWSYFPLLPWLAFPLAGFLIYNIIPRVNLNFLTLAKFKIIVIISSIVFLIFTLNYAISISSDLELYYHHTFLFSLWLLAFIIFHSFYINELDKNLGHSILIKYIKWLGENVTLIYVIQWIIIGNIATEIYKTISNPFYLLFCFIGIVMISSIVCYLCLFIVDRLKIKKS